MMSGVPSLTYKTKILLYLKDYVGVEDEDLFPVDVTQEGISEGVSMSRTHVSRVVQDLMDEDLLREWNAHVKTRKRKLKTYSLTSKGIKKADKIISSLKRSKVDVMVDGNIVEMQIKELEEFSGDMDLVNLVDLLDSTEDPINIESLGPKRRVVETEDSPEVDYLYGRGRILEKIDDWFQGSKPIAVLRGNRGYGCSSIASRFVDSLKDKHVLWINVDGVRFDEIRGEMKDFLKEVKGELNEDFMAQLVNTRCLLVLNDYYDVADELVDFLTEFVDYIDGRKIGIKVLVTAREGTPVYERFYQREHVTKGLVEEIGVPPLGREDAMKILGDRIEKGAMKRIMQFTKGSPLLLTLLRDGNKDELERASPLGKEHVSLLMFLKSKTEE